MIQLDKNKRGKFYLPRLFFYLPLNLSIARKDNGGKRSILHCPNPLQAIILLLLLRVSQSFYH
jgi:hypothetical protein